MTDDHKDLRNKKLRILQLISAPSMGGIENQLLAFLQRYDRNKFIVDVACSLSVEGPLKDKYLATGIQLIPCRWSRYIIPYIWRLFWILRRGQYDVVHARFSEISGVVILAAKLARVPIRIASYHHTKINWKRAGFMNRLVIGVLQRITRRWATKILSISKACLDVYFPDWKQHPDLFEICFNGIDLEKYSETINSGEVRNELGIPKDSLVVGHIGSFRKAKNHHTIIKIAERVLKEYENIYFLLVGDGELRQQIESEAAKRNISNRFIFAGNRDDVHRILKAMDMFVMPSIFEGFGTVAIEAQISGLVVIASNLQSIREALCPAMHEFCRHPLDAMGMSEQIIRLLKNPLLRSTLGRQGKEYVSGKFSVEKTVKKLESIYTSNFDKT